MASHMGHIVLSGKCKIQMQNKHTYARVILPDFLHKVQKILKNIIRVKKILKELVGAKNLDWLD